MLLTYRPARNDVHHQQTDSAIMPLTSIRPRHLVEVWTAGHPTLLSPTEDTLPVPSLVLSEPRKEVMSEQVGICMHLPVVDLGRGNSKDLSCCLSGLFCDAECLVLIERQVHRKVWCDRLVVLSCTHHHHCRPTRLETDSSSDAIHPYRQPNVGPNPRLGPNHRRHQSRPPSTPPHLTSQ